MASYLQRIIAETSYPLSFRKQATDDVLQVLSQHQSLTIVGMKRVGVSNFLRFITFNPKIHDRLQNGKLSSFIYLDTNDLASINIEQFWLLLLKRLVDAAAHLPDKQQQAIQAIYNKTILHTKTDILFLLEGVKEIAAVFVESKSYLVIVLARFDRLLPIFSEQFFANLQSIIDIAQEHISYIFTSYLPFSSLCPQIYTAASFSMLTKTYYLLPGDADDLYPIIEAFERQRGITIPKSVQESLIAVTGGHVQLLQLSLIVIAEQPISDKTTKNTLLLTLISDERIKLQCDEIFESLTDKEKQLLLPYDAKPEKDAQYTTPTSYLLETGIVRLVDGRPTLFAPIFTDYVENKQKESQEPQSLHKELTKKESILLNYLVEHTEEICPRDDIIAAVWPEFEDISDWALDQLVSRLRRKLQYIGTMKIKTNRGRGYQLVE